LAVTAHVPSAVEQGAVAVIEIVAIPLGGSERLRSCTVLPARVAVAPAGADSKPALVAVKLAGAVMFTEPRSCGDALFVIVAVNAVDEPAATACGAMSTAYGFVEVAAKPPPASAPASNAMTTATTAKSGAPSRRPLVDARSARVRSVCIFMAAAFPCFRSGR
jgi:hypothetical protein